MTLDIKTVPLTWGRAIQINDALQRLSAYPSASVAVRTALRINTKELAGIVSVYGEAERDLALECGGVFTPGEGGTTQIDFSKADVAKRVQFMQERASLAATEDTARLVRVSIEETAGMDAPASLFIEEVFTLPEMPEDEATGTLNGQQTEGASI